jgi:osmoprotectant transport system ATP-binding protein
LHGWVQLDALALVKDGAVRDHARRMEAWVPVGATLKQAFASMLQYDAGWIAVVDGARFVGVLTPARLHEALRRSIEADSSGLDRGRVSIESVGSVSG